MDLAGGFRERADGAAAAVADELGLPVPERVALPRSSALSVAGGGAPVARYRSAGTELRVGGDPAALLVRRHDSAAALGVPVPAALDGPFLVGGVSVTVFEYGGGGAEDWEAVGVALRQLHGANAAVGTRDRFAAPRLALVLGSLAGQWRAAVRLVCGTSAALAMAAQLERAGDALYLAAAREGEVLLHGSVSRPSVRFTTSGPRLAGWDATVVGPPSWDLAALAVDVVRLGEELSSLDAVVGGYGSDLRDRAAFSEFVAVHEWSVVHQHAWRAQHLGDRCARELARGLAVELVGEGLSATG